jgi:hypothetical protein
VVPAASIGERWSTSPSSCATGASLALAVADQAVKTRPSGSHNFTLDNQYYVARRQKAPETSRFSAARLQALCRAEAVSSDGHPGQAGEPGRSVVERDSACPVAGRRGGRDDHEIGRFARAFLRPRNAEDPRRPDTGGRGRAAGATNRRLDQQARHEGGRSLNSTPKRLIGLDRLRGFAGAPNDGPARAPARLHAVMAHAPSVALAPSLALASRRRGGHKNDAPAPLELGASKSFYDLFPPLASRAER